MDTFTVVNSTRHHHHTMPHFASIPNEAISILTPYSGLLMTIWLVILFFIKNWVLETFVFPRFYKRTLATLDERNKRGFLVHHISGGVKIILLIVGAKPFSDVVFGKSALHDPYSNANHKGRPTMGDVLLVLTQLFVALYVFELLTRAKVSMISSVHHMGAILIAQSAVVLSLDLNRQTNASMEFVLCLVWAAFDVLSELWLNVAFILYRIYPKKHALLSYVFGSTMLLNVSGTFAETVMIMTLFGQSWSKWELTFKIITPILHVLFTIAQLHCARVLFAMWMKQKKLLAAEDAAYLDPEAQNKYAGQITREVHDVQDSSYDSTKDGVVSESASQQRDNSFSQLETSTTVVDDRQPKKKKSGIFSGVSRFFTGR
jgi:hypothetical protein